MILKRYPKSIIILAFMTIFYQVSALSAPLTIEIIGGGQRQIPVKVGYFNGEGSVNQPVSRIVADDLRRSGLFNITETNVEATLAGQISTSADGKPEIRFNLRDEVKQRELLNQALVSTPSQMRAAAHRISDLVFEALTGEKGVFSTRIAYIAKVGKRFELQVADADGANPQTIVGSNEPLLSPVWSPDGSRLAYVSFENKKPTIYVQNVFTGTRSVLANFRGSNSAPAWSPDSKNLAIVLSKEGGSQLFLINADGTSLQRIMTSQSIDTEPRFSSDGQSIFFTSDRGGSPQIYQVAISGGSASRISFEGTYNVSPRPTQDGKNLIFVQRNAGRFQIALLDLATKQISVLTDGSDDESPTIAPNGKMILYATRAGSRGILAAVSIDGKVKQRLSVGAGDIREPAWGPFSNNK